MMLSSINPDFLALCSNAKTTEEATGIIAQAVASATAEIERRGWQARQTELDLQAHRKKCDDLREIEAAGIRNHHEAEKIAGRPAQQRLAAAEGVIFNPAPNA